MSDEAKGRLAWLDALRVVDALLVVMVHANILARAHVSGWWPVGYGSILLFGPCVPLFFTIAGFVGAGAEPRKLVERALRFLPLIVTHGVVLLLLGVADPPTLWERVIAVLSGVWLLYFLAALAQLLLLHALVLRLPVKARGPAFWLAVLGSVVVYGGTSVTMWGWGSDTGQLESITCRLGPTWGAFYAVGVWLGGRRDVFERISRRGALLVLLSLLLGGLHIVEVVAEDARFGHATRMQQLAAGLPYQLVASVTAMALASRLERTLLGRRIIEALARVAATTLAVYLLHGSILWSLYWRWVGSPHVIVHVLEVPVLTLLASGLSALGWLLGAWLPRPLAWALVGRQKA